MTAAPARAWDAAVAATPAPSLLQSWAWGELQGGHGWTPARRRVTVDGVEVPVSLLIGRALPAGRFGYVPHGPPVAAARLPAALERLAELGRELGLAFLRVEPGQALEPAPAPAWPPPGWHPAAPIQPHTTSIVDLRPEPDALLAGFKPKTRYNLRLAERRGVEVTRETDAGAFAQLSDATASRHGIRLAGAAYYRDLLATLGPERAWLYLARHQGRPLAGIIVGRFAGTATYLFGASGDAGRELMPAYLLHWRAMLDLRQAGDLQYDLWGFPPGDDPHHPWAGLRQFKAGWNGHYVERAGAFDLPLRPALWRAHKHLSTIRDTLRQLKSRSGVRRDDG
ncbi:MAG TPA: peptidoglycan bridge formation glycyltransferase FemA/FemB family protein [Candidatus Dormibacteraeota bacterium]|nr:peptidoglycan bridge formation glycyltransferase FemA/FemB family protein [Candidatus Dormibacteraeota bacterium]